MIQFALGATMMALGVGIIFAVRSPDDKNLPRDHPASLKQVLLSNVVLVCIVAGGALMALALL